MNTTTIDTVVVGAGHAGLAVSHLLTRAGRDHVVLDRGRIAEAWRTQRWDSLRLLTPRWLTRLPGWRYTGADQEGFMPVGELVRHLERYAATSGTPLELGREVHQVSADDGGYRVVTDGHTWRARHVVIATGAAGHPNVPAAVHGLAPSVARISALDYRNPDRLPAGGVLVIGASASGAQIADELARAGRRVMLAVGRHTRLPRSYRGMDAYWWLQETGRLARTIDTMPDPAAARREPSLQLVGRPTTDARGPEIDLGTLREAGVELTGHLIASEGRRVRFADDLTESVRDAHLRMSRFLDAADLWAQRCHLGSELLPAVRPEPIATTAARTDLDLEAEGIATVILATGYRPHHPWLQVPVLDRNGAVRQVRGATPAPGLLVVGQRFQHRRDSASIDGARHDAHDVVAHICRDDAHALEALEVTR